ncbi:oligopeptide/dipeptide ABC transporter ATP-binding protein, partial [Bacillus amyloliquefaciens]|uniref:oligopeptide/dipeptide ABC transporter ATP-binding protein n=1 Tax=Bacillus amyloliquefaciens TaxID=1390 RepID=UPI0037CE968B
LMKSIPSLDGKEKRLYSIQGKVPIPGSLRQGCTFAPRCEFAMDVCRSQMPKLQAVGDGHASRCWLHQTIEEGTEHETAIG